MGSWKISLDLATSPPEFEAVAALGLGLSLAELAGLAIAVLFAALWLRDLWRASRGVPLDAHRYAAAHAVLSLASRWRSREGEALRARGRAALVRVFGPSWWRTFVTERAVRGRLVAGVAPQHLRACVSVYLDALVSAAPAAPHR